MSQDKTVFESEKPEFKKNYDLGWIGFSHSSDNLFSKGIAHFTRWDKSSHTKVTHTFIVSGEDECIEANQGQGVVESKLSKMYFDKENCFVVFRKPKGLTDEIASQIVETARDQLGASFDYGAVGHQLLQNNFLGWLVNQLFNGQPKEFIVALANSDSRWICSELVAYCLREQSRFQDKGVLSQSLGNMNPQKLFEDEELFEPLG